MSIADILKCSARYVKLVKASTHHSGGGRRPGGSGQLREGDILEVLGTTMRSTKQGVKHFVR